LQQTAAQPFAISLGDPSTGSHRLNLAGGINSLGTTLGPIIVSFFLFGSVGSTHKEVTVTNINNLYLMLRLYLQQLPCFLRFQNFLQERMMTNLKKPTKHQAH
jgi:FHS family L-fucose permease-like MFS transporter